MQVTGGTARADRVATVERFGLLCASVVSLVLWLALHADFSNALLWAAKLESHPISGSVRMSKVALCLGWSLLVFVFAHRRYCSGTRAILALLAGSLLAQIGSSIVDIRFFDLPFAEVIVKSLPLTLLFAFKLPLMAVALAYVFVTSKIFATGYERIVAAASLGLCSIMLWTGLFDVLYPGIAWR